MKEKLALLGIVSFSFGIFIGSVVTFPVTISLFLLLLSAGLFLAWFFGRRDAYCVLAIVLCFVALGTARVFFVPREAPHVYTQTIGNQTDIEGEVIADPDIRETNQRIIVRVGTGEGTTKILAVADRFTQIAYGDYVHLSGVITQPEPFATDGGREFAYDSFLAKDGIFLVMKHATVRTDVHALSPVTTSLRFLYEGKKIFTSGLESALPEPHASLAEGLIAGGKEGLGNELLNAFTTAGLLPIIVLSGYNVMIVAEFVLVSVAFLPKRFALTVAGITVALFVIAAGGGTSAVRAGLMAGLGLFARATGRTYDALRALLFVFIYMLLISPLELVYDPGFQFSFAATLGLILASTLIELRLMRIRFKILREVVATTCAAQLFVLPLLLYQTGNLSLIALPANILVLPVIPLAMGASAFAGISGLVVPVIATFIALPAYALLTYVIDVGRYMAQLPFAHVIIPSFQPIFLIPLYAGITWIIVWLRKTAPKAEASGAVSNQPATLSPS